jgi:hypothetical protein
MLRGHVNARAVPIRVRTPRSGMTYPDWRLSRVQHYLEAHSHPDKENAQIVSISLAPVDGSLSKIKQF